VDLILKQCSIASDGVEFTADVAVEGGVIHAIGLLDGLSASETVDCHGLLLLPGAIDLGLNLGANGEIDPAPKQSFAEITQSALLGGVTTVVACEEFAIRGDVEELVAQRAREHALDAWCDFGYHFGVRGWDPHLGTRLRSAALAGVTSARILRTGAGAPVPGPMLVHATAQEIPADMLLLFSPWDPLLFRYMEQRIEASGSTAESQWESLLPRAFEAAWVRSLAAWLEGLRGHAMIVGISSAEAVEALRELRSVNGAVHGSVNVAALAFAQQETGAPRTWPPIREKADQKALYAALEEGLLSAVCSDHRARTAEEMVGAGGAGAIGLATLSGMLPLLYSEGVAKWQLSAGTLSQCLGSDAAKLAGLYPRKGAIQAGADADLVLIDPNRVRGAHIAGPGGFVEPLSQADLQGSIERVYLRGRLAVQERQLIGASGGQFLHRRQSLR
jgi:dihydropyrimidinase